MRYFIWSIIFLSTIGLVGGCDLQQEHEQKSFHEFSGTRESVSISLPETPPSWLTILAVEQGFFSERGLDVTAKYFPSGKRSLQGMFNKQVDIASVADVPFVLNSFERQDFSSFSVIGSSNNDNKIVARRESGIRNAGDLKGKRIATQEGSAAHFFLYLFLMKNGLLEKDIEVSYLKVEELPGAISRGDVDAISTREPFLTQTNKLLGGRSRVFAEPGIYFKTFHLVAFNSFIKDNPDIIHRILESLLLAETFVKNHPGQAAKILSNKLNIPESEIMKILSELDLRVFLDQIHLLSLEDEAQWLVEKKLKDASSIPNYLNFIHLDALEAVRPQAVSIIR